MMGGRVVVVGASVAGLMTALAFARGGAEVELVDRDAMDTASQVRGGAGAAIEAGWRKGVPQARHTHACAALGRRVLRERAPDVWAALLDAGAVEMPFGGRLEQRGAVPRCDDPELMGLSVRRSVFEAVLRRIVLAERNVAIRFGVTATGLLARPGPIPLVEGIRTSAGDLRADLTIDASGRASPLGRWLRGLGARAPDEAAEDCGLVYLTRWYRIRRRPAVQLDAGLSAGGYAQASGCIACPADNDHVSITLMTPHGDSALSPLSEEGAFTAAASLHAGLAAWMEPGALEPLSPVMRWPGCENRFRRFVVEGEPVVLGALAVGDSICVTNPTYSRGMSLATRQAFALADIVASEGLRDLHGLALRADDLAERTLRPWFSDSVAQDGLRKALWRGESGPRALQDAVTLQQIAAASRHDDLVWHALARRSGMLDEPDAIFARPEVQARVRAVIEARPPAAAAGPSRTELLRLIDELAGPPLQAPPIS